TGPIGGFAMVGSVIAGVVARLVPLGLLFTLAVMAVQSTALAQQPSGKAVLLARQVITTKGAAKICNPPIVAMVDRPTRRLVQTNPMLSRDLNEIAIRLKSEYASRVAELLNEVARLYATRFTEGELKDILAFYKSGAGQKAIAEEPLILDQSVRFAEGW